MSVLFNKDKDEMIVTCKRGCDDSLHIKIDMDDPDCYAFLMFMNGNWYTEQNSKVFRVISKKLKKIWAIIRNKDYYYADILMSKEEFEEFREFVNSTPVVD